MGSPFTVHSTRWAGRGEVARRAVRGRDRGDDVAMRGVGRENRENVTHLDDDRGLASPYTAFQRVGLGKPEITVRLPEGFPSPLTLYFYLDALDDN